MQAGGFDINIDTNMRLMKNNENSLNLSDINSNIKIDKVDVKEEEIKFDDILDAIEKYEDMVLVDEEVEKKQKKKLLISHHLTKVKIILFLQPQEKISKILKKIQ